MLVPMYQESILCRKVSEWMRNSLSDPGSRYQSIYTHCGTLGLSTTQAVSLYDQICLSKEREGTHAATLTSVAVAGTAVGLVSGVLGDAIYSLALHGEAIHSNRRQR